MLIVNRLGPDAVRYYATGPVLGHWEGSGGAALGLEGIVEVSALRAVLAGVDPHDGTPLPARIPVHRRSGWDLIFAAPKSVSLLAGFAPPGRAEQLSAAHVRATEEVVGWLEAHACWARRGATLVAGDGVVAARFDHGTSASGDPHLHTHLLLANLVRAGDGRWSALDGSSLWVHRRALAAAYHLALRHHLVELGLRPDWRLAADGSFDVGGVPRGAIDAASRRGAHVQAALGRADGATGTARRAARTTTRPAGPSPWWTAVSDTGFGAGDAAALAGEVAGRPPAAGGRAQQGPEAGAVTSWLAERRSTFTAVDVMTALAATAPGGATAEAAQAWAERFCASSLRTPDGRHTTIRAAGDDRNFFERGRAGQGRGLGAVTPAAADWSIARRPELDLQTTECVRNLTTAGDAISVLGAPTAAGGTHRETWIAQAVALDAARAAWEASGHTVVVVCPPPVGPRWAALTAIDEAAAVTGPPTVLVVDRADRLSTPQLSAIAERAEQIPAKVVLVRGGTLPPRRRALSEAFEGLAGLERVAPGLRPAAPATDLSETYTAGRLVACGSAHQAINRVVSGWQSRREPAVMVGLGPAEVVELNARARDGLRAAGVLSGPDVVVAGRFFAVGDRVIPLRHDAGAPGAEGRVVAADPRRRTLLVEWGDETRTADAWSARHLGHAYAVTPAALHLRGGPVMVLGAPEALGRHAARVTLAALVPPGRLRPGLGADAAPSHLREAARWRVEAQAFVLARLGQDPDRRPGREPARDGPGLGR